jgi:putative restriction endonuclease
LRRQRADRIPVIVQVDRRSHVAHRPAELGSLRHNDPVPVSIEDDRWIRQQAMAWLTIRTNDGRDPISTIDLDDFTLDGRPFRLKDRQQGIWKPASFRAALSIQTVYRADGRNRPYADDVGADGLLRYKWRGTDPNLYVNVALREAMNLRLPLIWFFGVGVALWQPVFPVYILAEEPAEYQFVVDPDVARTLAPTGSVVEEHLRRYIIAETRRRLHQPVFRASVMRAYGSRCALCSLRHGELLDAAHIVPDGLDGGEPVVRNGLALCKIHHAAFDARIVGIRPDLGVEVRADLLAEIDGPMLRYGIQGLHGGRLMILPEARSERPDPERLEWAYERFRAAPAAG